MNEIIKVIKNNQLFDNISEDEIKQVLKCAKAQIAEYKDNQVVFQKDDTIKKLGIGNSKALILPYNIFFAMCREVCGFHKTLINNMLAILSDKIVMLNNKMHILNAETLKGRIAVYLLTLYKKNNSLIFDMPMKRQELADFLNVKRPSLSRELSNMQQDEIIEVYRSTVKITDLEKLKEIAD